MSIRKRLQAGFTLVELMIVVAIVGVLAVLAVYGVKKYISNSKTAEARNALGRIGKDAASAYEGEKMDPTVITAGQASAVTRAMCATGTAGAGVPSTFANVGGKKYQSQKSDWAPTADATASPQIGYPCLRFELNAPQYYQYAYRATGASANGDTFVGEALGDLDNNGTKSTFRITGKIQEMRLTIAPQIFEENADE
jgi:type IV pilus assembly protein PilA